MRRSLALGVALALLVAPAMVVPDLQGGTVLTVDGVLREGELGIDRGLSVRDSAGTSRFAISGILRARFSTADARLQPGLLLVNGGRIAGRFSSLGGPVVKIEAKRIAIPAKEVAWAIYQPLSPAQTVQAPRGKTGALLAGGDFFQGNVRGGDPNIGRVVSAIFGPGTFAAPRLQALVLRDTEPQAAAFDVLTGDGSIYPALDVTAGEGAEVIVRHPLYQGMRLRLADLVEIRASASRLLPLDDIPPSRVDPAPGRDAAKCFSANLALDGGPLKLGTRKIAAGFECVTGSTVWWKPPPAAGNFFALVAAGAGTPAGQKLTFTVYADGKLAGQSAPLAAGDPPAVLRCAVPGAATLALRIDGDGGSGTWAEPMLLRR